MMCSIISDNRVCCPLFIASAGNAVEEVKAVYDGNDRAFKPHDVCVVFSLKKTPNKIFSLVRKERKVRKDTK